jgi:hypothetical protein
VPASTPNVFVLGDDEYSLHPFRMAQLRTLAKLMDERMDIFREGADKGKLADILQSNLLIISCALNQPVEELENLRGTVSQTGAAVDVILHVAGLVKQGEEVPVGTETETATQPATPMDHLSHYDNS